MNALHQDDKVNGIDWPGHETGLRAYTRIEDQRLYDRDTPCQHNSLFEDIDRRIAADALTAIAQQRRTLDQIRKAFVIREDELVMAFLKTHRSAPSLLLELLPELQESFGEGTVFILKVLTEENGSRDLYVAAEWPGPARDAMAALDNFVDWWMEKPRPSSGRLHFTYELK